MSTMIAHRWISPSLPPALRQHLLELGPLPAIPDTADDSTFVLMRAGRWQPDEVARYQACAR